ncbi:MAG: hypothetical protein AVDCRST_MAG96-2884 [uncultured Segetibacter sp.]|uniref:Uncharacterized protein n=1 Tax=uncultured Segetibacter sp. TaxID=481133 RepID=A0A6J4TD04_9BACT|nr:MAG: hypothetical protein AVDCRST_MAG96-2884 [uncultured Segetibacter sp.]
MATGGLLLLVQPSQDNSLLQEIKRRTTKKIKNAPIVKSNLIKDF